LKELNLIKIDELLERLDEQERIDFYTRLSIFLEKKRKSLRVKVEYP
jgi:hypothetical protein